MFEESGVAWETSSSNPYTRWYWRVEVQGDRKRKAKEEAEKRTFYQEERGPKQYELDIE